MAQMKERGIVFPWGPDEEPAEGETGPDDEGERGGFGRPEAEVTTHVDVSGHLQQKRRSMECHRTQRQDMGWLLELPPDLAATVLHTETFVLRWLDRAEPPPSLRETSLLGE
jgi:LmbE family N-acetylglucosaminyl deacetylase